VSQSQLGRIELGRNRKVSIDTATTIAAVLGLDLVLNLYAGRRVLRDQPQVRLLQWLRDRLGDEWIWRYEVRVAAGDQRAWDARARHRRTGVEFVVEAETRIYDVQAMLRRIALKRDADPGVRVVLLVADTHRNRDALKVARQIIQAEFPVTTRIGLRALAAGADPGDDTLVILGPDPARPDR
jgi:hypothetical protein